MRPLLKLFSTAILLLIGLVLQPVHVVAQQTGQEENLLESLESFFKQDYLSIGVLLQSQGEFHWDPEISNGQGENTFRIPTARLKVDGMLDENFSYLLQMDATRSPALLDMNITYDISDQFSLSTGLMKPGISAGYLLPAASTDFVNRPRVSGLLVANRDIGVLGSAELTDGLTLSGGIFNGRSQNINSNDNDFYYTGRIEAASEINTDAFLQIGGNIGYGEENGTLIGNGSLPAINGTRLIYGGDLRFEFRDFLLSTEFLGARLEYSPSLEDEVLGFHLTGGYWATDKLQFLVRLDHVESNELSAAVFPQPVDLVFGGINYNFTEAASFTLNYQLNPETIDISNQVLLAQMQITF